MQWCERGDTPDPHFAPVKPGAKRSRQHGVTPEDVVGIDGYYLQKLNPKEHKHY
jgi:hypothetical protein